MLRVGFMLVFLCGGLLMYSSDVESVGDTLSLARLRPPSQLCAPNVCIHYNLQKLVTTTTKYEINLIT